MKKRGWLLLGAFLVGILLANLCDKELLSNYGIWNEYFINQYSYRQIDCDGLFAHVFLIRFQMLIVIFLIAQIMRGRALLSMLEWALSGTFGFLVTIAISNLGIKGIILTVGGLFPQWFFYIVALLLLLYCGQESKSLFRYSGSFTNKTRRGEVLGMLISLMLFLIGIVMESYINPFILEKIVKIM